MQTYISILRGINVSGHKLIKMKALQELYENLGFSNVRTYIQSGNVVFGSKSEDTGKLEKIIASAILKNFEFEVPIIVLKRDELNYITSQNMFLTQREKDISKLHVTFLSKEPEKNLAESIGREEYSPDEYNIVGKAIYLFCPQGYGNTKLNNNFFEKKLKVQATTRNWKTVLELLNLSE